MYLKSKQCDNWSLAKTLLLWFIKLRISTWISIKLLEQRYHKDRCGKSMIVKMYDNSPPCRERSSSYLHTICPLSVAGTIFIPDLVRCLLHTMMYQNKFPQLFSCLIFKNTASLFNHLYCGSSAGLPNSVIIHISTWPPLAVFFCMANVQFVSFMVTTWRSVSGHSGGMLACEMKLSSLSNMGV